MRVILGSVKLAGMYSKYKVKCSRKFEIAFGSNYKIDIYARSGVKENSCECHLYLSTERLISKLDEFEAPVWKVIWQAPGDPRSFDSDSEEEDCMPS